MEYMMKVICENCSVEMTKSLNPLFGQPFHCSKCGSRVRVVEEK